MHVQVCSREDNEMACMYVVLLIGTVQQFIRSVTVCCSLFCVRMMWFLLPTDEGQRPDQERKPVHTTGEEYRWIG